jgi:hypothetical protein
MTFVISLDGTPALMEAEQLNIIANRLSDLSERNNALRGYL